MRLQRELLRRYRRNFKNKTFPSLFSNAIFVWLLTLLTVILIVTVFLLEVPTRVARDVSEIIKKSSRADGSFGRRFQVHDSRRIIEKGTDKYIPIREEERHAEWVPKFGLEIDAWDPRTHDPRRDPEQFGAKVKVQEQEQEFFLSAMIFNRVFEEDKFNITLFELRQWLEYMKYAGVSHVFWYDTGHSAQEYQEKGLKPYIQKKFITYYKFHELFPNTLDAGYNFEQDQSEIHCIQNHGGSTKWLLVVDIDEYVFMPRDTTPGFLERHLRVYEEEYPKVSQILLQCLYFIGQPKAPLPHLLIERYQERKPETEGVSLLTNARMKAIIDPSKVERVYMKNPHSFEMKEGKTVALSASVIRLNHYHGPRAIPVNGVVPNLVADNSIQPIADEIRSILKVRIKTSRKHVLKG